LSSDLLSRFGDARDGFGGCIVQGIPAPCNITVNLINSGAGVQCPDNDCRNFRAFADGFSGYLPPDAKYMGNGRAYSNSAAQAAGDELGGVIDLERTPDFLSHRQNPQETVFVGFDKIWEDLNDILENATCRSFIADLIGTAQEITGKKAHAFTIEGMLEELKKNPWKDPKFKTDGISFLQEDGISNAGWENGKGYIWLFNQASQGTVNEYFIRIGQKNLALTFLHEIIHTATKGRSGHDRFGGYNDVELARAVFAMFGDKKDDPDDPINNPHNADKRTVGGLIWNKALKRFCKTW
jgi:hypothetical protein